MVKSIENPNFWWLNPNFWWLNPNFWWLNVKSTIQIHWILTFGDRDGRRRQVRPPARLGVSHAGGRGVKLFPTNPTLILYTKILL